MSDQKMIGFLGAGQLARMSALSAISLGYGCSFYDSQIDGPCADLGTFFDPNKSSLKEFANYCDVITLENEFISSEQIKELEKYTNVFPSSDTYSKIENKLIEKQTFNQLHIPTTKFEVYNDDSSFGFPVVMKSCKGGYDGYGNFVAKKKEDLSVGLKSLNSPVLLEQFVPYQKEVAVTVARNASGEIYTFPVVDTVQEKGICTHVIYPAKLSPIQSDQIQQLAIHFMQKLNAVGVFSFEFFITDDGVLINECAPRPHNSAHYSMNTFEFSQFDYHILAITNQKLPSNTVKYSKAVMINLLGTDNREKMIELPFDLSQDRHIFIHDYQKKVSRVGRKMGHANIVGDNLDELIYKAEKLRKETRI